MSANEKQLQTLEFNEVNEWNGMMLLLNWIKYTSTHTQSQKSKTTSQTNTNTMYDAFINLQIKYYAVQSIINYI